MSHKTADGLVKATAEIIEVLTPTSVPDMVECYVSKRKIAGDDARLVKYDAKKEVWVHKRFLGEVDEVEKDDDDDELSAIEDELDAYEEDLAEEAPEAPAEEAPAEEPTEA